jgi:hypothetical protein
MHQTLATLLKRFSAKEHGGSDTLASLIMAAQEDAAFRARLVAVLRLPLAQRRSIMNTAIEEMRLRGEPAAAQQAFAMLTTDQGAQTALRLLALHEPSRLTRRQSQRRDLSRLVRWTVFSK